MRSHDRQATSRPADAQAPFPAKRNTHKDGLVHLVLFDGDCAFCNRTVQWLLKVDRNAVFAFTSLQGSLGRAILKSHLQDPDVLSTLFVVPNYAQPGAALLSRSSAAIFIARQLGWPWRAMSVSGLLPLGVRDFLYDLIARHRYQLMGKQDHCRMPSPEFRDRFPDSLIDEEGL